MSPEAALMLLGFVIVIAVLFYGAGRLLGKYWKYLGYLCGLLFLTGLGLVIFSLVYSYTVDCSGAVDANTCGLGAIGYWVVGLGLIFGSAIIFFVGLPMARKGNQRKK